MRHRVRNRNNVAGAELLTLAVTNRTSSELPVADDAAGQHFPAGHEGCVATDDVHHVDDVLVVLDLACGDPPALVERLAGNEHGTAALILRWAFRSGGERLGADLGQRVVLFSRLCFNDTAATDHLAVVYDRHATLQRHRPSKV